MVCNMKKVFVFLTIMLLSFQQIWALRPLKEGEKILHKSLLMQSLQRGPVQGSGANPCSTVAGRSHGRCNAEVNVPSQAHVAYAPQSFPNMVDKFGAASSINVSETQKKGSSSSP